MGRSVRGLRGLQLDWDVGASRAGCSHCLELTRQRRSLRRCLLRLQQRLRAQAAARVQVGEGCWLT